ncbi:MAG: hypothetical protein QGG67_02700 [Gammaproteobacteria bacterium]|nr:hypothetical protein [Gammaproteobacteria bacterium]MDP6094897.1 hypothetical protein [Gammaproteobacteria bacterium]HJO12929.1 hypothetical protein [Gammaproteobacteria bacterium]
MTNYSSRSLRFIFCGSVLVAALSSALSVSAQNSGSYTVPRTVDGTPDLQGMWTNNTITSLSRPDRFGDKLVLTAQEAYQLELDVADYNSGRDLPSDPDRAAPVKDRIETADSYNNFWMDGGTTVVIYNNEFRSSLIVDPPNGQIPAYTPEAQNRIDAATALRRSRGAYDGPESRPLAERCIMSFGSSSGPPMLPVLYNNHYQIVQSAGYVMILVEMVHDVRIIRVGDQPLPEGMERWMGDSVGHWEGDTLVVETSEFNPSQRFRGSSENLKVTERFTRVADNIINYGFTVEDPDTYTRSWSAEMPLNLTDDRLYEYACHEGNYSLSGVLAGARLAESEER